MSDKFEYVYILTNPAMPEWVKVGKTSNIKNRLATLSDRTAVPLPFECYACLKVPSESVFNVEHGLHKFLGFSFQKEKEFFRTSKDRVLEFFEVTETMVPGCTLLRYAELNAETPTEKKKAAATTFELLQIPEGSELVFIGTPPITCKVVDKKNQVEYEGKKYALSDLATKLCGYRVSGYQKFMFEDELLYDRRQRLNLKL